MQADIWAAREMVSVLFALLPALPHCVTAAGTLRGDAAKELKVSFLLFLFLCSLRAIPATHIRVCLYIDGCTCESTYTSMSTQPSVPEPSAACHRNPAGDVPISCFTQG